MEWHKIKINKLIKTLRSSKNGLNEREAASRLKIYGPNEIIKKRKKSDFIIFLEQFKSFLVIILLVAVFISFLLKEWLDGGVILAIVLLNSSLGFFQVKKAERALEELSEMARPTAVVIREGKTRTIPAKNVVPGEILYLKVGDVIPADCRILEQVNLKTDESILTGESTPVIKEARVVEDVPLSERRNMLYSGTTVVYGWCTAIAVATGMNTEFGKIASALQAPEETTPLQKKLDSIGKQIGIAFVAICLVIFFIGALSGIPFFKMFLTALALAVAAVPEGLLAAVTTALALGTYRMARKNSIVRRLAAVEGLGSTTVICVDKTGTLTVNEMTVRKLFVYEKTVDVSGEGYSNKGEFLLNEKQINPKRENDLRLLLTAGLMCNDAKIDVETIGDPTELALLVSAKKAKIKDLRKKVRRVEEIPFDSERKMMSVAYLVDGKKVVYTKGAVEGVLKRCQKMITDGKIKEMTRGDRKRILEANYGFARSALRVMAFAIKETNKGEGIVEKGLVFLGLQAMADPPRKEVFRAIENCKKAGIKIMMITGDHRDTAIAIAKEIGVSGEVMTGTELDKLSDKDFEKIVEEVGIYARVSPEHKMKIIKALKKKGHVVAMTGDGINDAPALKEADIGIAMGQTGTDVTREVGDLVLADDNFATIVSAVEEGRGIYDNIRKCVAFLLSGNIAEVAIIALAVILGWPLPLMAIQILWINLVTDGFPALALSVDPTGKGVMERPPRKKDESIFSGMRAYIVDYPSIMTLCAAGLFLIFINYGLERAQTVVFTTVVVFELFQSFSCRSLEEPVGKEIFANKYLVFAAFLALVLHLLILYVPFFNEIFHVVPIGLWEWVAVIFFGFVGFVYLEFVKSRQIK